MSSRRRFSKAEREQRRLADRERVKEAANELLSSEGWARWVGARQTFHAYSIIIFRRGVADAWSTCYRRRQHVVNVPNVASDRGAADIVVSTRAMRVSPECLAAALNGAR